MADIKSPEERSKNMAAIKSRNTKPEVYLRKKLFSIGVRYRLGVDNIPGHPDLWLKKYNTAVFVHGCFWHRHKNCRYAYMPKSRIDFWSSKFDANILRDRYVQDLLYSQNIKCLIVWECTVRKMQKDTIVCEEVTAAIVDFLCSKDLFLEL